MFLRNILKVSALIIFSLLVLGYTVYRAIPLILGPEIVLSQPSNNSVEGTSIVVSGTVYRANTLSINGISVPITPEGKFNTRLAIYPGSNIMVIQVTDRFGRVETISKNLRTNN